MSKKKVSKIDFESTLIELTQIVEEMEHGQLSLQDALMKFERGVQLTRQCQDTLKQAEQQVKILLEDNGNLQLEDFEDKN